MHEVVWTPTDIIALVTAIGAAIAGIIGAIRGTAAKNQAATNAANISQIQGQVADHAQQLTTLSEKRLV